MLDLCGLPLPADVEGASLRGAMAGEDGSPGPAIAEIRLSDETAMEMIHDGRWKLVHHLMHEEFTLFDLDQDPLETRDVSEQNPAEVERLTRLLLELVSAAARRANDFEQSAELDLSPALQQQIKDLGYGE